MALVINNLLFAVLKYLHLLLLCSLFLGGCSRGDGEGVNYAGFGSTFYPAVGIDDVSGLSFFEVKLAPGQRYELRLDNFVRAPASTMVILSGKASSVRFCFDKQDSETMFGWQISGDYRIESNTIFGADQRGSLNYAFSMVSSTSSRHCLINSESGDFVTIDIVDGAIKRKCILARRR